MSQQSLERHFEYRPQRKVMKALGILMIILPLIGGPVLLSGGVTPAELAGFELNAFWSAVLYIGFGILCAASGAVVLAGSLRKAKAEAVIRFTEDSIVFPDLKTGDHARVVAYKEIQQAAVEDRGKGKRLRITHAGGTSWLDSEDMESLSAFEEMNAALQKRL